jgi:MYXO-CTERM domain-containing protein
MRTFVIPPLAPAVLVLLASSAFAQETRSTPGAHAVVSPAETSAASPLVQETPAANPTPATSTETQRTVVSDQSDSGKWGLLGLLGLLGLVGLRRREGEVNVVNRTTPRPPVPPVDPASPSNRR